MQFFIISLNIIFIIVLIPACFAVMFSAMLFDAPGSQKKIVPILIATAIIFFPLIIIISNILSWIYFSYNNLQTSLFYACIPLIWIGVFIISYIFIWLFSPKNRW